MSDERDPLKDMLLSLDFKIVRRGGSSMFDCRPTGKPTRRADARLKAWLNTMNKWPREDQETRNAGWCVSKLEQHP